MGKQVVASQIKDVPLLLEEHHSPRTGFILQNWTDLNWFRRSVCLDRLHKFDTYIPNCAKAQKYNGFFPHGLGDHFKYLQEWALWDLFNLFLFSQSSKPIPSMVHDMIIPCNTAELAGLRKGLVIMRTKGLKQFRWWLRATKFKIKKTYIFPNNMELYLQSNPDFIVSRIEFSLRLSWDIQKKKYEVTTS